MSRQSQPRNDENLNVYTDQFDRQKFIKCLNKNADTDKKVKEGAENNNNTVENSETRRSKSQQAILQQKRSSARNFNKMSTDTIRW